MADCSNSHDSHSSQIDIEHLNTSWCGGYLGSQKKAKGMDNAEFMHLVSSFVTSDMDMDI